MRNESIRSEMTQFQSENGAGSGLGRNANINEVVARDKNGSASASDSRLSDIETHAHRLLRLLNEIKPDQLEQNLRTKIQTLELRLQNTEAKLLARETDLKEKEKVIQAAATREKAIGKLVVRLSSECEKLTAELYEKSLLIERLEEKTRNPIGGGKVWKKVLGLVQGIALAWTIHRETGVSNGDCFRAGGNGPQPCSGLQDFENTSK